MSSYLGIRHPVSSHQEDTRGRFGCSLKPSQAESLCVSSTDRPI